MIFMLSLVQIISLFLMVSGSLVFDPQQPQPTSSRAQGVTSIFSPWGCGTEQVQKYNLEPVVSVSETRMLNDLRSSLPILNNLLETPEPTLTSWEKHLKEISRLLFYFKLINNPKISQVSLFNFENPVSTDLTWLSLTDLKILSDLFLSYDEPLWSGSPVRLCSLICKNHCDKSSPSCSSKCLLVSAESCFLPSSVEKLNELLSKICYTLLSNKQPKLITFPFFLYCKTPCCQTIHQVVVLIIIKRNPGNFNVLCCESFERENSFFSSLDNLIQSIFGCSLEQVPCYQQSIGFPDDLSGCLALINARHFLNSLKEIKEGEGFEFVLEKAKNRSNFPLLTASSSEDYKNNFQRVFKDMAIRVSLRHLCEKLSSNLCSFAQLFCLEREELLESASAGIPEVFRELLSERVRSLETLFEIIEEGRKSFSSSSVFNALNFFVSLKNTISDSVGERYLFDKENSHFGLLTRLFRQKLKWIEQEGKTGTPPFSPLSFLSSSVGSPIDVTKAKVIRISSSPSCILKDSSQHFPLLAHFLNNDLNNDLTSGFEFSSIINEILNHWKKDSDLFSANFSPERVLTSKEGVILAELICGFRRGSNLHFFTQRCSQSFDQIGSCATASLHWRHCPTAFQANSNNCFLVGSGSSNFCANCFKDNLDPCFNVLKEYRDGRTEKLTVIGRCVTGCCQVVHQSWALVVLFKEETYQAFYFDPLGQKTLFHALCREMNLIFGGRVVVFSIAEPYQSLGSLDFSGVLAICGAKVIVDSLAENLSVSQIENKLFSFLISPSTVSSDFQAQAILKDRLVIVSLKRLFFYFLKEIEFNCLPPSHRFSTVETERDNQLLVEFVASLKPKTDSLFSVNLEETRRLLKEENALEKILCVVNNNFNRIREELTKNSSSRTI